MQPKFEFTISRGSLLAFLPSRQTRVRLRPDGVGMAAVDPARSARVGSFLDTSAFESFTVGESTTIGLNLTRLTEMVGLFDPVSILTLTIAPDRQALTIDGGPLEISLGLLDPDEVAEPPLPPDVERPVTFGSTGKLLTRGVRACRLVYAADRAAGANDRPMADLEVGVVPGQDVVTMDAEGDTDNAHYELSAEDLEVTDLGPDRWTTRYQLSVLRAIMGANPPDASFGVRLGEGKPLQLRWTVADGGGVVEAEVAPVVDDEVDEGEPPTADWQPFANAGRMADPYPQPSLPPGIVMTGQTVSIQEGQLDEFISLLKRRPFLVSDLGRIELVTDNNESVVVSVDDDGLAVNWNE